MAQLKAHEVDRYLANEKTDHRIFLVYGPDAGLVAERARTLAKATGADLNDPFSTIKLQADEAASDPLSIADEAFTVSMFGGIRLIWIRGSTQRNLISALQPVLDQPPTDCLVLVEAGDLKKTSPLRSRIEKSPAALALPCFPDQARTIGDVIDTHFSQTGSKVEPAARALLISLLGGDRMATRSELEKLSLYASGSESITAEHVEAVVGDASTLDIDVVVDAASVGDIAAMEHMLKRLFGRGATVFSVLSAAQRHFQMLHQAKCRMRHGGQPASSVIAGIRPPVNFRRKDNISKALSIWTPAALERLLNRLDDVSLKSRARADLAIPLMSTALLAIAIEAAKLARS